MQVIEDALLHPPPAISHPLPATLYHFCTSDRGWLRRPPCYAL